MTSFLRPYKFSGMIPPADELHAEVDRDALEIAPAYVHVPGGKKVAQYAPTIVGCALGYNPAQDCRGYFTSSKFQANNNCYNYACSIASNSYAQPGRLQGFFLQDQGGPTGAVIVRGAKIDGLLWIGRASLSVADLRDFVSRHLPGHVAALFISPSDNSVEW